MQTHSGSAVRPANRLGREKSPYLLQHQYNPVDWRAWGEEAFAQARAENRPIFLSIGYSTCHWCHVMERESFESEKVAQFLNQNFVSIKVDREERPDVDKIYMTFVQATAGQGGWPLNVFLTPDLKPFYGGTYFPPDNRYGRPAFLQILQQIAKLWQSRPAELAASAADIHSRLLTATLAQAGSRGELPGAETLQRAGQILKGSYDSRHGGFGNAPKFPQPSQPQFLLRYARRFEDPEALRMVLHTCDRMAAGGIHDQLGGGFSRYSVDAEWLVPHFEKMLYDNAQLAELYLDAYLASGEERHARVARDILEYILRDMTHPEGGFYSAEDADSEGQEGKFYCWTRQELAELLAPEELSVASRYFGLTERGNFVDHSHPQPLPNLNVLSVVDPNLSAAEERVLASARARMLAARAGRVRPHLDDKVLASWNGLMLGAMARAGVVLGQPRYLAAAEKNIEFLRARLWDEKAKRLFHRWRDGERDNVELLEGYAFLLWGVLGLYEATAKQEHLEFAIDLAEAMVRSFYDAEHGGFWQSPQAEGSLILRLKEDYDGAEPSGNSVATLSLLRLGNITGREDFTGAAERTLELFAGRLREMPQALPFLLSALDFRLEEPVRIVITAAGETGQALREAAHGIYRPNKVVLSNRGPVEAFARTLPGGTDGNAGAAYLCTGSACQAPTTDPERLRELLKA